MFWTVVAVWGAVMVFLYGRVEAAPMKELAFYAGIKQACVMDGDDGFKGF